MTNLNLSGFANQMYSKELEISGMLAKSFGYDGDATGSTSGSVDALHNMLISALDGPGSGEGANVSYLTGWNYAAIIAKSLQYTLAKPQVFIPKEVAEVIAQGKEMKAASSMSGLEFHDIPEDWVQAPWEHRINKLMRQPNKWIDGNTFRFMCSTQVETHGVANVLRIPNENGLPSELHVIPETLLSQRSGTKDMPSGYFRTGNLLMMGRNYFVPTGKAHTYAQRLAQLSNQDIPYEWIIRVGLPSVVYMDHFINPSSALSDTLETDKELRESQRQALENNKTKGPMLSEEFPGAITPGEKEALVEEYQDITKGGRPFVKPPGVAITENSFNSRDMEYVKGAEQVRDDTIGQRNMPPSIMGMGDYGSFASVVANNRGWTRNILQPLMSIFSGQLTVGLKAGFEAPADEFLVLMQAGTIDDPQQKLAEWGQHMDAGVVTKGTYTDAFNLPAPPEGQEDELVGPSGQAPGQPGTQAETGIGAAVNPSEAQVQNTGALSDRGRRQQTNNSKMLRDILSDFAEGKTGPKRAQLLIQNVGFSPEDAAEFVESVNEELAAQTESPDPPVKSLFQRSPSLPEVGYAGLTDVPPSEVAGWINKGAVIFKQAFDVDPNPPEVGEGDRAAVFVTKGVRIDPGQSYKVSGWDYVTAGQPLDFAKYFAGTDYSREQWPEGWSPSESLPGHFVLRLEA